jgi:hypothetical protein
MCIGCKLYHSHVTTSIFDIDSSFYRLVVSLCRMAESTAAAPSTAAVPSGLPLIIQLPGSSESRVLRVRHDAFVDDVIDAILSKFKALEGYKLDQLELFKLSDDGSGLIRLEPSHKLKDAGLLTTGEQEHKLVVELKAAAHAPASSTTGKCPHSIVFPSVVRSSLTWSLCFVSPLLWLLVQEVEAVVAVAGTC